MGKTRVEKIESLQAEIEQLEHRRRQLIQEQKKAERTARTRRLCQRMGLFESMLPDAIALTDEHFKTFLEKTILSEFAKKQLTALLTEQNAAEDTPIHASVAAQGNATTADQTPHTAQQGGDGKGADEGDGARGHRANPIPLL